MEENRTQFVVFAIEGQQYVLHLQTLSRIVRAVEVTPLPKAPEIVLGVINVRGRITPVVDIRKRFSLPCREIDLSDQIIIVHTLKRNLALIAERKTV